MTKLINKLINQGQEYLLAGGGSKEGDKIEYLTEEEYEALTPEQKSDEDTTYMITGEGSVGPVDSGTTVIIKGHIDYLSPEGSIELDTQKVLDNVLNNKNVIIHLDGRAFNFGVMTDYNLEFVAVTPEIRSGGDEMFIARDYIQINYTGTTAEQNVTLDSYGAKI